MMAGMFAAGPASSSNIVGLGEDMLVQSHLRVVLDARIYDIDEADPGGSRYHFLDYLSKGIKQSYRPLGLKVPVKPCLLFVCLFLLTSCVSQGL
jgi:hypothetical protein